MTLIKRNTAIENFSIYMPLPLVYQMNNLGQKHMFIDGDKFEEGDKRNLIYQHYEGERSLVVEKGFWLEAQKQVGPTLFKNRVLKELASYQKIVHITPEMRKARRGVKYAYVEKKEIE